MWRTADTGRGDADLAGIRLGVGDELAHRFRLHRGMHDQDIRGRSDLGDGREVPDRVIRKLPVNRRDDRMCADTADQQCVAVRARLCRDICRYAAACPWPIVDQDAGGPNLAQLCRYDTRDNIDRAARCEPNDHAHRFVGISLG